MSAREAAVRATIAKFVQDRVAEVRRSINADVMEALDAGDRKGAVLDDGTDIGTVSVTRGRKTIRVTDADAYLEWVREHSPQNVYTPEPETQVRAAYTKALTEGATVIDGLVVDATTGEIVPGLMQSQGDPFVSVKISDDQADQLVYALRSGLLDGLLRDVIEGGALAELTEGGK